MQILVAILIALLVLCQYLLWIDADSVRQTYTLRISVQAQTDENAILNERNRALEADIKDLKTGLNAIEERARSEMGMIRQDETFYRLLEPSTTKAKLPKSAPATDKPSTPIEAAPAARPTAKPLAPTTPKNQVPANKPGTTDKPDTTDNPPILDPIPADPSERP